MSAATCNDVPKGPGPGPVARRTLTRMHAQADTAIPSAAPPSRSAHGRSGRGHDLWLALRINVPYWWVMAWNLVLWVAVRDGRFPDRSRYLGLDELEAHWEEIRAELDALAPASPEVIVSFAEVELGQARLAGDGRWRVFLLRFFGHDIAENRARCPRTAELLDGVAGLRSAMFSVLDPGKHLPGHTGACKGVVRYHLGLAVPPGDESSITIGGVRRHWREGEGMLFDDTYWHRARNDGRSPRTILLLDVDRRLPRRLGRVNRAVLDRLGRSARIRDAAALAAIGGARNGRDRFAPGN